MENAVTKKIDSRMREIVDGAEALRDEMAYSLFAGGKRLRPCLLIKSCESASGSFDEIALDFACAVEMIHTYSLIHDDLPAMDNDSLRRGIPTSHIKFGEAAAILTGDALLNLAFETTANRIAQISASSGFLFRRAASAIRVVARASGSGGMIAGQAADMAWEGKSAGAENLLYIHSRKTGALITASIEAGAILGGASGDELSLFRRLGEKLGLAFQILDDILDITATEAALGKPVHSDWKNGKNTYVSVFGMERALSDYGRLREEIFELNKKIPRKAGDLSGFVGEILINP